MKVTLEERVAIWQSLP